MRLFTYPGGWPRTKYFGNLMPSSGASYPAAMWPLASVGASAPVYLRKVASKYQVASPDQRGPAGQFLSLGKEVQLKLSGLPTLGAGWASRRSLSSDVRYPAQRLK